MMNLVAIESPIGLDRLATREEVPSALSFRYRGAREPVGARGDYRQVDSDFTSRFFKLDEDTRWVFILSETPHSMSN